LLPQAVAWLASEWKGEGPLDLSRILVVVPTRQSGRRLREALATYAAAKKQAVFPPRVLPPETLLSLHVGSGVASRLEALLAWTEVFDAVDLAAFRDVFPVDPPARNFSWRLRLATEFLRLQSTLAEAGLTLKQVARSAGANFPETARWIQLGELEQLYASRLERRGLREPQAARIAAAGSGAPLPGIEKIVLLAAPDPLPLALSWLAAQAHALPVEIVVFAPPAEEAGFDRWGRPIPSVWTARNLDQPKFTERVHLCADPDEQAERVTTLAKSYTTPEGRLGVGVTDPEIVPLLTNALTRANLPAFNPEGRPRRHESLFRLLAVLASLVRAPTFPVVEELARCPEFLALLAERCGENFSKARWLTELDALRARHLPADLKAAREHATPGSLVAAGLIVVDELHRQLAAGNFSVSASLTLRTLFSAQRLDLAREEDARFAEAAGAWTEMLSAIAEQRDGAPDSPPLSNAEWWELALQLYGGEAVTEEKKPDALELQGWLELLWEDAPHLIVAGLNDGRVPDAIVGDAFLPETLRVQLGLKTNAARFARDAYIFQAVVSCRARADWLFGKTSANGDPLRPSRLLMRCPDEELPERITFLFRAAGQARPNLPWRRAWRLVPRVAELPTRIRVTALRDYLRCPFRFYLRHVLRMESVDAEKNELDALDFGTLCHFALEQLGLQPELRDATDVNAIREALWGAFDGAVRARFGRDLALPLLIQCESARQRLGKAAEIHARERSAGWVIEAVEKKFEIAIGGLNVSGKIDRIERHLTSGARRVIDYKTSDMAIAPEAAHFERLRPGQTPPEWQLIEEEGKMRIWADLQLPLYLHALKTETDDPIGAGYFNLPKAVGETDLVLWSDYSPDLQSAALRCAESACAAIRAGVFWPPNETIPPDYDEFASLFHQGVAASVAWEERK
jgi:ATP-dependent helicase/nuclease subunit B